MNNLYSKDLSKSVVAAKNTRLKNKINCLSTAPYGYRLDAGQRKYFFLPEYAQIIKHIFEEYIKVPNKSEIARQLNEQSIFSPGSYRLYSSKNFKGNKSTKWSSIASTSSELIFIVFGILHHPLSVYHYFAYRLLAYLELVSGLIKHRLHSLYALRVSFQRARRNHWRRYRVGALPTPGRL
jgi:hypothetical protein